MDVLNAIISFVEFLLMALVASVVLFAVLSIVISLLPKENPVRHLLTAFAKPLGIMVAAEALSLPLDLIPPIEVLYDIAAVFVVGYSWLQFIGEARIIWPFVLQSFARNAPEADANLTAVQCFAKAQAAVDRKEYLESVRWYRLAAERGHAGARKILDDLKSQDDQTHEQADATREREEGPAGRNDRVPTPYRRAIR